MTPKQKKYFGKGKAATHRTATKAVVASTKKNHGRKSGKATTTRKV